MSERAFITGILGQDGSYLNEALLGDGIATTGSDRKSVFDGRSGECKQPFDITNSGQVRAWIADWKPTQIYHLAALHGSSEDCTKDAADFFAGSLQVHAIGLANLLEAMQAEAPEARLVFAASSHVFGAAIESPQDENTPMTPISPYGISKAAGVGICAHYRNQYGIHASSAILYNHESPRRGENFVTQKICRGAAAIAAGQSRELRLGDTSMRRDWSDARDIVRGMWLSLQVEQPDDYILASGEAHTVQAVVEIAFETVGLDWEKHVVRDEQFNRSADPARLVGDPSKARAVLDWELKKGFRELIVEMTLTAQRALI